MEKIICDIIFLLFFIFLLSFFYFLFLPQSIPILIHFPVPSPRVSGGLMATPSFAAGEAALAAPDTQHLAGGRAISQRLTLPAREASAAVDRPRSSLAARCPPLPRTSLERHQRRRIGPARRSPYGGPSKAATGSRCLLMLTDNMQN
jgi:hypothetical protein